MSKHTPKPWRQYAPEIDGYRERDYRTIVGGKGLRSDGFQITGFISEEDAQLIAAAPELLEACQQMVAAFEYSGSSLVGAEYMAKESIKAAIAKATGNE